MRALVAAIAVFGSCAAVADEGELAVGASAGVDVAGLHHPGREQALPIDISSVTVVPRLSLDARFGLTNELDTRVAVGISAAPNLVTSDVLVAGVVADFITGTYASLEVPLGIVWRLDTGSDIGVGAELELVPSLDT